MSAPPAPRWSSRSRVGRSAIGYRLWIGGPVPPGADAITLGRTIIARRRVASSPTFENLLRHELTHVEQWRQLGHRVFLRRYVGEYLAGRKAGLAHHDAYLNISLEQEARCRARGAVHDMPVSRPVSIDDVEESSKRTDAFIASLPVGEFRSPSLLPGWSVGHVVAHLAANAEAMTRVLHEAEAGRPAALYDSVEQRTNDIDNLSVLPAIELTQRLLDANSALVNAWRVTSQRMPPEAVMSRVPGSETFPIASLVHRRLREIEVHASDIGSRMYTYESWSPAFVNHELHDQWHNVASRVHAPLHFVDESGVHHTTPGGVRMPAVHATRRSIVAWLLSRHQPTGFPPVKQW